MLLTGLKVKQGKLKPMNGEKYMWKLGAVILKL